MVQMEDLVSLCKRRGFVFQNSEIYGGINGFWDYGPIGVELRRRVKDSWWRYMVLDRRNVVGVDTTIIAHPQTWVASGHVGGFSDPMVDCKGCKKRFRADEDALQNANGVCPECKGELTAAREFNLMFKTFVGPIADSASEVYLRPETCQSIFTQFKNVLNTSRQKPPFGIAQIGKAFRNEINPRNFTFRSREFEQMEMEFFIDPAEDDKWFEYWVEERFNWFKSLGLNEKKLRLRVHKPGELAHYAKTCTDVEYEMPFGWSELEGIAHRSDYDLSQHIKESGKDLDWYNEQDKKRFVPFVIESSAGVDRAVLALLVDAYDEEEVKGEKRVVLRFKPTMAPIQVAVFPLSKKLGEGAMKVEDALRKEFITDYDEIGSIGKRYRRHDEIGTPFCVTYDFDSETDNKVTVRERDTMAQERILIDGLESYINDKFKNA